MNHHRQRALLVTGVSVAAVAFVIALVAFLGARSDDQQGASDVVNLSDPTRSAPVGDPGPIPISADFETFDGGTTNIAALSGQPVVVNFWASTCQACIKEMPDFEAVHQAVGSEITFVGINTSDRHEAALEMVDATEVSYLLAKDPDGTIFRDAGGLAMPTTLFLDSAGGLVDSHAGILTADQLTDRLEELYGT